MHSLFLNTIFEHPTVSRLVKFLETVNGREKVLRLIQFLTKFIITQQSSLELSYLHSQLVIVRKFFRFFKPVNHWRLAMNIFNNKLSQTDGITRWANILKNIFFGLYLFLDQINLLKLLKLVQVNHMTSKRIPRWTNMFWLIALLFGVTLDIRKIQISNQKLKAIRMSEKKSEDKEVQDNYKTIKSSKKERDGAVRRLVWDSLDSVIVLNNLQYLETDARITSLFGIVTSVFGIQDIWNSC